MKTNNLLFSFAAILSLFHTGCGEKMCSWSQRTIPRNATGDLTLEVPISYSYKVGYLGNEKFWTYGWEKGWCSYNEGYFRCPYTKHDDYDATSITLPNVEKISYVMLRSQYPITIHKSGDESFPGFYAKEGTALDICTDKKYALLRWFFNGKESNLQDMSCYQDNWLACRGLRPPDAPKDKRCGYTKTNGRMEFRYTFIHKGAPYNFFYCYANKEETRALTFIIDWRGAPETTPGPDTTADIVQEITTTAAANLTGAPETTPGPDTTADIVQEITTTEAANLTGAPETTPGPDTTADIVQEITTTEAANLTDSPETTLSPVTTKEMMNETANSGARSFIDAAGLILFNLWLFLV
ncbi:hypothetical protein SprV_0602101200 [Sparganum proliferum]